MKIGIVISVCRGLRATHPEIRCDAPGVRQIVIQQEGGLKLLKLTTIGNALIAAAPRGKVF